MSASTLRRVSNVTLTDGQSVTFADKTFTVKEVAVKGAAGKGSVAVSRGTGFSFGTKRVGGQV